MSQDQQTTADWLIMTPTPDEWEAACSKLDDAERVPDLALPTELGRIGSYSVACVLSGKGESNAASALQHALNKWKARWVLLVGIAGGFPDLKATRGSVVIANFVYSFDYGKLIDGKFLRRPEYDYSCDRGLLNYADVLSRQSDQSWTKSISILRPDTQPNDTSKAFLGYVASSDKVVDDADHVFFKTIRDTIPEIHAVEMEGIGSGSSIKLEQSKRAIGFLMVRGISDEPLSSIEGRNSSNEAPNTSSDEITGSEQCASWKQYPAHAAATFVRALLLSLPQGYSPLAYSGNDPHIQPPHRAPDSKGRIQGVANNLQKAVKASLALLLQPKTCFYKREDGFLECKGIEAFSYWFIILLFEIPFFLFASKNSAHYSVWFFLLATFISIIRLIFYVALWVVIGRFIFRFEKVQPLISICIFCTAIFSLLMYIVMFYPMYKFGLDFIMTNELILKGSESQKEFEPFYKVFLALGLVAMPVYTITYLYSATGKTLGRCIAFYATTMFVYGLLCPYTVLLLREMGPKLLIETPWVGK